MAHALSEVSAPAGSGPWADFGIRLASAAVLAPVALFCLWHGGWAWKLFIAVALCGLGFEWGKLAHLRQPAMLSCLLLVVWLCAALGGWVSGLAAVLAMCVLAALVCGRFAAAGIPYAGVAGVAVLWLRAQPVAGFIDMLFLVVVVWSTDIGAYLAGRFIGGPKLAPRISPGKTWSGAFGGFLASGIMGGLLAGGFHGFVWRALAAGLLLSIFAQAGDLLESAIKRRLGVKDSGRTIPGHGGLFDRLDGFLTAAPLAAILALSVERGLPLWG